MRNAISPLMAGLAFILAASPAMAADPTKEEAQTRGDEREEKAAKEGERSPWLFVPLLSSSPKLDTAAGLMVGYLHQFDEGSRPSFSKSKPSIPVKSRKASSMERPSTRGVVSSNTANTAWLASV